ncbi:MAG: hypothetical protein DMG57_38315 [Acidobacteria bacterium]|nr:MAG: hypothetical protein DMG57_38315 [Acidobacteriota bacterium]
MYPKLDRLSAPNQEKTPEERWRIRLTNPLREICTVVCEGGVPWGSPRCAMMETGTKLETVDTAKESLKYIGSPLLGKLSIRRRPPTMPHPIPVGECYWPLSTRFKSAMPVPYR